MTTLSDRTGNVATRDPDAESDAAVVGRAQVDERLAARRRREAQAAPTTVLPKTDSTVAVGPRPRASMFATLSLIFGVAAVLTVLTGMLAGPGLGLGVLAALLGIGGVSATSRRHVAGKGDALLGIMLGLGAVVVASLALTGVLPWLTGDTNLVTRARDWLEAQLPWMFPSA